MLQLEAWTKNKKEVNYAAHIKDLCTKVLANFYLQSVMLVLYVRVYYYYLYRIPYLQHK